MKLTKWQQIGVVLSIVWAAVAATNSRNDDVERTESFAKYSYEVCAGLPQANLESCDAERQAATKAGMEGVVGNAAFAGMAPIPFGWLAGFILIYAWRIQVAGFRACIPWAGMSRPKRGMVVLCFLALGAAGLFASMVVMNLYVDAQVPVALSPLEVSVYKGSDEWVHAAGTWTRQGRNGAKSGMAFPLQTSAIDCYRAEMRCFEARGSVSSNPGVAASSNLLDAELVQHDIESWTKQSIVMRDTALCAEEVYTIDLNTKAVSGSGHAINAGEPSCKPMHPETRETEWSYRMQSGFPVYWEIRSKARPWPLRVMQSILGRG